MNGTVSGAQLRAFIERIERLEEEKRTIADDIKDVKAEAKGCGFDLPTINAIIKLRKKDAAERDEAQAMLDLYMSALGMLPLFEEPDTSYSEAKGRGFLSGLTDEQKAAALAYDGEDGPVGEITDNQDQIGGNGTDLPVEAATEKQAAGTSRPTISHSPDDLLPVAADTAGGVAPPAPPATLSDPYDPGPIPAFLDRRQPKAREWEDA